MDVLLAHLYLLCGLVNIVSSFAYIWLLYLLRYIDYTFLTQVILLSWECLLFTCFAFESTLHFSTSFNKVGYVLSFTGITDLLSLLALTSFLFLDYYTALTLQFFRCFRLLKIMQGVKSHPHVFYGIFIDPVPYEILHTITSMTVLLLVVTGAVQAVSYRYPEAFEAPTSLLKVDSTNLVESFGARLFWHECLYFVIVTVTTVGYGDIFPMSTLSRMLMVLIMIIAFSLIPTLLSDLVHAFYARPLYAGSLSIPPGRKHILICGIVNSAMLLQLLLELESSQLSSSRIMSDTSPTFYDNSKAKSGVSFDWRRGSSSVLVVILSPQLPNRKVKLLLDSVLATYAQRVMYFVGSTKVIQDLRRVKLQEAMAVLILGDEPTSSMRVEEDSIFLSAISISNYLEHSLSSPKTNSAVHDVTNGKFVTPRYPRPNIVTFLTHTAKLRPLLISAGVDVVLPFQHFKYSLLGVSVACPGFLALFMKLNRPHFESYAQQYPHYLSNHSMPFIANSSTSNHMHSLDNLPYLKSTGTEHSIYQVVVTSLSYSNTAHRVDLSQGNHRCMMNELNIGDKTNSSELSCLISQLPHEVKFQYFASIVFRLSCGDVILIGTKTALLNKNHQPPSNEQPDQQKKQQPRAPVVIINPGRHVQINQCLDLFCIAKTRAKALSTVQLACHKILSQEEVQGPRGSCAIGSLESLSNNLLLREISHSSMSSCHDAEEGGHHGCDNSAKSDKDLKFYQDEHSLKEGMSITTPLSNSSFTSVLGCNKDNDRRWGMNKKQENKSHAKNTRKKRFAGKNRSRHLIKSVNLKKLSPFSFPIHDDDGMSVATGHSVTSTSIHGYEPVACSSLAHQNRNTRHCQERSNRARSDAPSSALGVSTSNSVKFSENSDHNHVEWSSFHDDSSSNDYTSNGEEGLRVSDHYDVFQNHLVLILSSSGTKDTISSHALLLPIIHILTSYRAHSPSDKVVVLSERADELCRVAADTSVSHPGILKDVHFYLGSPRNMVHLRLSSVLTARAVVLFHHPTPSTVFVQGDDDPSGQTIPKKLNADRHTIIISLNLHFLLEEQSPFSHPQRDSNSTAFLRNDNYCPFTFAVAEVRHESSVAYLRRSISTISAAPSELTLPARSPFFLSPSDIANRHNHAEGVRNHSGNCFDMLSAGGVMTAPVFNSLLLQSILNPNIITLWENMLSGRFSEPHPGDNRYSTSHHNSSHSRAKTYVEKQESELLASPQECASSTCDLSHKPVSSQNSVSLNSGNGEDEDENIRCGGGTGDNIIRRKIDKKGDQYTKFKRTQTSIAHTKHFTHHQKRSENSKSSPTIPPRCDSNNTVHKTERNHRDSRSANTLPILGRIACPALYTGLTYGLLFEDLLERSDVVCMGVHRLTVVCSSGDVGSCNNNKHNNNNDGFTKEAVTSNGDIQHQTYQHQQQNEHSSTSCFPQSASVTGLGSVSSGQGGVVLDSDSESCSGSETGSDISDNDEDNVEKTTDNVSIPYVFVAPSSDFILDKNDYIFILRCPWPQL